MTEVASGRFREDLYYRLHVLPIPLPPLRERGSDIIEIANAFVARYAVEEGKQFSRLSPDAEDALLDHNWPGNVRELQNVTRQATVLHDGEAMTATMLGLRNRHNIPSQILDCEINSLHQHPMRSEREPTTNGSGVTTQKPRLHLTLGESLRSYEREIINATIAHCDGSIPKASRLLDVSPSTIYRKLESWAELEPADCC